MNMLMIGDTNPVNEGSGHSFGLTQVTCHSLKIQNEVFKGSGGISQENSNQGFCPAFRDSETGSIYLSRFADGTPAPMHMLDGLPQEVVIQRTVEKKIKAVKSSVTAGFIHRGRFYTRRQAATVTAGGLATSDVTITTVSEDVSRAGPV